MKKQSGYIPALNLGLTVLLVLSCVKPLEDFGPIPEYNYAPCWGCNQTNTIVIFYSRFSPDTLTVKKGESITWSNADAIEHNIIPDNSNGPSTGLIPAGGQFQYTAGTTGSYRYRCGLHGEWAVVVITP